MTTAPGAAVEDALPALADAERLGSLQATGLLAGDGDPTLDRLARLAAALIGSPRAFVTLVTDEAQHLPGMVRLDDPTNTSRSTTLGDSLCQFAVATQESLVIEDGRADLLVRDMETVRRGEIGAYAGVPLRTGRGHVLGTLCVVDSRPRPWPEERMSLLEDLSALATDHLEKRIGQDLDTGVRQLAAEMTGRIPPLTDAVHSLVSLAEEQEEPRLLRFAALTRSRLEPVTSLSRRLQEALGQSAAARPERHQGPVDLRAVARRCLRSARATTGTSALRLEEPDVALPVPCDGVGLERSLSHVMVTALHHSREGAEIVIRLDPPVDGDGEAGGPQGRGRDVTLTLDADDSRVPTGELARIVSRFAETACGAQEAGPATIRIVGGAVVAQSGSVHAEAARDGRFRLVARWPLAAVSASGGE